MLHMLIEWRYAADPRTQRSERNLGSGQNFFSFFQTISPIKVILLKRDSEELCVKIETERLKDGIH